MQTPEHTTSTIVPISFDALIHCDTAILVMIHSLPALLYAAVFLFPSFPNTHHKGRAEHEQSQGPAVASRCNCLCIRRSVALLLTLSQRRQHLTYDNLPTHPFTPSAVHPFVRRSRHTARHQRISVSVTNTPFRSSHRPTHRLTLTLVGHHRHVAPTVSTTSSLQLILVVCCS